MKTHHCLVLALIGFISCSAPQQTDNKVYTAFTGATIIDGTGAAPIPNGVLLVANGRIVAMGTKNEVTLPDNITIKDLSGKTIIPGLINAHGHVGDVKGIEGGHYSKQNLVDNLSLFARYGVTTVVSLGADKEEAVSLRAVADTAATQRARLYIAGEVISGNTPEEAVAVVDQNDTMGVDFMKIRVDDNLGSSPKMSEEIYKAVISRSHELGYKIATHMYYLDDAKKLLAAGSDFLAHSVRDLPVNDELIGLLKENEVCYCPTLTRELSTYVYEDTTFFFSDPFFQKEFSEATVQPLLDPARQQQIKNSKSAQTYKQQLPTAMANLKTLSDNGVTIAFGTDSGIPTRFMGYFEHLEMAMMADAGLSPMQVIVSATSDAAKCLGLKGVGKLVPGYWADFVVLDANPLEDIKNSKSISGVWIGGEEVKN
ncbi:amidohydrolase family protein [uncultured Imperialibacter sp.]|uniref:amidohydrolase family protein n=1 Tax=uncultured Imperialibacter sp. TaxID=1672639 RepID=UPI0030DBE1C0|tara:strand:- start:46174 stop:47454 length:1281 start_codon:yes stop_codon:yes gene_type:complete